MDKTELHKIAQYVSEVEQDLMEQEYDNNAMQVELGELYRVIKRLMDASAAEPSSEGRTKLAKIEYKARQCRDRMIELTAVGN